MGIFRVEKNKNYTVMSNYHLKNKEMSLKAKGLLSIMLSLPDDWDYSIAGLESIVKEGRNTVAAALKELERHNHLKRQPVRVNGKIVDWEYTIYEEPLPKNPQVAFQDVENQDIENQDVENCIQLNTNKLNTDISNTKEPITNNTYIPEEPVKPKKVKEEKHKYGEYQKVLLTDKEYQKLVDKYGSTNLITIIDYFDKKIEMKGYKYKSHYLAILDWAGKAALENRTKESISLFKRMLES